MLRSSPQSEDFIALYAILTIINWQQQKNQFALAIMIFEVTRFGDLSDGDVPLLDQFVFRQTKMELLS